MNHEPFDGGALEFINAHMADRYRIDAGRLLNVSALPTAGQAVEILRNPMLRAQAVRVVTDGRSQPARNFARRTRYNSKLADDSLDSRALRQAFTEGSTVIIEDVGKWHPPVAALCNRIFNDRWLYANASYFITRSASRGLPFHADEETTFVFQLAGSKSWQVASYPAGKPGATEAPPDASVVEFVARPGDALCVPPMYAHRTEATGDGDSIHLTIGVRSFKLKDFFMDLAERGMSRVPALDEGIESIDSSVGPLCGVLEGSSAEAWRRELAVSSICVASGLADRGFEFGWRDRGQRCPENRDPVLGDLAWRVRLGHRSMVYLAGTFAMMDDAQADALCAATGCDLDASGASLANGAHR